MMAMYDGNGDITTSDWRVTIEKRDGGVIAWRFIAGEPESDAQIDTIGNASASPVNFNPGTTYFWRATWGGGFDLRSSAVASAGDRVYDFGKGSRAPTTRRRTSPSSARRSAVRARTTPRSSARRGASSTSRDAGKKPPDLARHRADREPGRRSAHQDPRHPRRPVGRRPADRRSRAPAPERGPALFIWPAPARSGVDAVPDALEEGALIGDPASPSAGHHRAG